jgi:hypothetical protein
MNWLKRIVEWVRAKAAPVPKLAPVRTITERELEARFLAAPGSPLWEATLTVVDHHILAALDEAMDQKAADRDHRWCLAKADALAALRDDLRERERNARVAKEEAEETRNAECGVRN